MHRDLSNSRSRSCSCSSSLSCSCSCSRSCSCSCSNLGLPVPSWDNFHTSHKRIKIRFPYAFNGFSDLIILLARALAIEVQLNKQIFK